MKALPFSMTLIAAMTLASTPNLAQQIVYPAKKQTAEQQKKDEAECHIWAVKESGYDPASPPPPPQAAAPAPVTGSGARLKGAAAGAIVGGATGGDAGDAAVAGAVGGAVVQRSANRKAAAQGQQQAAQQQQAGQQTYLKARGACLEGRGYTVK